MSETILGSPGFVAPEQAAGHGVYCAGPGGQVKRFLQKPSPETQVEQGAWHSVISLSYPQIIQVIYLYAKVTGYTLMRRMKVDLLKQK